MNKIRGEVINKMDESPFRQHVVGVETKTPLSNGQLSPYINLDNAATTPPLKNVIDEIINFAPLYSSIHRGKGYKSRYTTQLYEKSREVVADFVNGDKKYHTVIYVKNTTEAINKLSYRICQNYSSNKCVILATDMEHHSNDLPWRDKYLVDYIKINKNGQLSLEDLEMKLIKYRGKVRLVTVTGASNVTGYINPVYKIAAMAHHYGSQILVDGAQLIPHKSFDMKSVHNPEHIDFLTFSTHKMYAPFGSGVLIGPTNFFSSGKPDYKGGGTVKVVTHDSVLWEEPPHNEEAGTPNIMGIISLTSAIKTLNEIGMDRIDKYETRLATYTRNKLKNIKKVIIYNKPNNNSDLVGIIPFNIKGINHDEVAQILADDYGIAVRNGCFCAQPYIQKLLGVSDREISLHMTKPDSIHPGVVRISLGMYNNKKEIDILIDTIKHIASTKTGSS